MFPFFSSFRIAVLHDNEGHVLFEGFIGKLRALLEGVMLEIEGTNGNLHGFQRGRIERVASPRIAHPQKALINNKYKLLEKEIVVQCRIKMERRNFRKVF